MAAPEHLATPSRRRPKDRKQHILAAAAAKFRAVGYHNVSMADIAHDVGITPGALYRHFRNKQDLLTAAVTDAFDHLAAVTAGDHDLDTLLANTATLILEQRELGVLWEREARHLSPHNHRALRERFRAVANQFATAIADVRPGLAPADADLLAWAVLSVFGSPAHHTVNLDSDAVAVLQRCAYALCHTPLPASHNHVPPHRGATQHLIPVSRREALLASATRLFSEQGFHAVGMTDIGAAADLAATSLYNHFTNKTDILVAALNRANETLWLGLHEALHDADSAEQALAHLVRSFIKLALRHPGLIGTLITEVINLPEAQRHTLRRTQHEYVTEWVALLRTHRAELTEHHARILVHATLTLINDLARTPHLHQRLALAEDLTNLAHDILAAPL